MPSTNLSFYTTKRFIEWLSFVSPVSTNFIGITKLKAGPTQKLPTPSLLKIGQTK
jgi:hypothetical protein